ncbi:V-ATPase subunit H, partial [Helicosporidium sp. ATCC 50920]
ARQAQQSALEYAVVAKGLPRVVEARLAQAWDDADVPQLLEQLRGVLEEGVQRLSSLECFRREVLAGVLSWGPLHRQGAFWYEHADKLLDQNALLLKALLRVVETAQEPTTLAVACNDLHRFVSHCPAGRGLVVDLGGKQLVMRLVAHPDADVRREALLCIQNILLSKDKVDVLQRGGG